LINIGTDILPTLLDYAETVIPSELPGNSLRGLVEKTDSSWNRDYLIVQNHMNQTGEVNGIRPSIEGRLVVTKRFKYAIYSQGIRRESLYDLENDSGETRNLILNPEYKTVLTANRNRLREFAETHSDSLAVQLLENNVAPIPVTHSTIPHEKKK
jgi:arylsulfatase A-like enzyme